MGNAEGFQWSGSQVRKIWSVSLSWWACGGCLEKIQKIGCSGRNPTYVLLPRQMIGTCEWKLLGNFNIAQCVTVRPCNCLVLASSKDPMELGLTFTRVSLTEWMQLFGISWSHQLLVCFDEEDNRHRTSGVGSLYVWAGLQHRQSLRGTFEIFFVDSRKDVGRLTAERHFVGIGSSRRP